jgi:hypothetical protein
MDWGALADAFVALMQALSLGMLGCGAVIWIREGLGEDSPPEPASGLRGACRQEETRSTTP